MKDDYSERMRGRIVASDKATNISMIKNLCILAIFVGFFSYGVYKFVGNFL